MLEATLSIPKYRRHASGQARVTFPGPKPRRTVYLGPFGSPESKQAYQRAIQEWLAQGGSAPKKPASERLVQDVIEAYQKHAEAFYRESPKERQKIEFSLRPMRELYAATPASRFGPLALKAVRQRMIASGLALRTVNMRVGVIKRMFKWAVEHELLPAHIWHALQAVPGLRRGKSEAKPPKPISPVPEELVQQTLPRLNRHVRAMVEVQRLCGCRSGEIIRMRGADIDRSGSVWVYRPVRHKTSHHGHAREIYLGPKTQAILQPFLKDDPQAYLFSPRQAREEYYEALRARRKVGSFVSRKKARPQWQPGDHYTVWSYRQAIRRACRRGKLPMWHPHQLRHSAGTDLRKEFGVEVARIILGHRTLAATEIYSQLNRQQALDVMARVG